MKSISGLMKNSEVIIKANMMTSLMVPMVTFLWSFLYFFNLTSSNGYIENPDIYFDGSNDEFTVGSHVESLPGLFDGSNGFNTDGYLGGSCHSPN